MAILTTLSSTNSSHVWCKQRGKTASSRAGRQAGKLVVQYSLTRIAWRRPGLAPTRGWPDSSPKPSQRVGPGFLSKSQSTCDATVVPQAQQLLTLLSAHQQWWCQLALRYIAASPSCVYKAAHQGLSPAASFMSTYRNTIQKAACGYRHHVGLHQDSRSIYHSCQRADAALLTTLRSHGRYQRPYDGSTTAQAGRPDS